MDRSESWTITGARHAGITVSDMDRSLAFYRDLLGLELLEYKGCELRSGATEPSRHGTGHFCMFVRSIDALFADLQSSGVRFRSDRAVEMTGGPNKGGKSLYSLDPDGYIVEFHQRPPAPVP